MPSVTKTALFVCLGLSLSGCMGNLDFDLRGLAQGFSTKDAAIAAKTAPKPVPDANGVISYPNYQVVSARGGETVGSIANRLQLNPGEIARYNGVTEDRVLMDGEIIALPTRIDGGTTAAGTIASGQSINISEVASTALDNVDETPAQTAEPQTAEDVNAPTELADPLAAVEPIRHQVQRGETAYTIARKYNISVRVLADWNGLDSDLSVQEGRYLLIPVAGRQEAFDASDPGAGSATPTPPSAATPLPRQETEVAATETATNDISATQTSRSEFQQPVSGAIIRGYDKNSSKFVLFAASSGTPVQAAKDGTVKLISTNSDGVRIMVIDHGGGLQTGYSFIDGILVEKGERVSRGQRVASVTANEFGALQFMVFKGTQTVDPAPYLN